VNLGRIPYQSAFEHQTQWIEKAAKTDTYKIFSFESEPVITMGLRANEKRDILHQLSVPILPVNRGGEATYHGPGQLLIFPAIHLPNRNLSVRSWVALLLDVTALFLSDYGIDSNWSEAKPGIFTEHGKIASIGIKIKNGWNLHGLALNVNGSLAPFSGIRACGVSGAPVDQMGRWLPEKKWDFAELSRHWEKIFAESLSLASELSLE